LVSIIQVVELLIIITKINFVIVIVIIACFSREEVFIILQEESIDYYFANYSIN